MDNEKKPNGKDLVVVSRCASEHVSTLPGEDERKEKAHDFDGLVVVSCCASEHASTLPGEEAEEEELRGSQDNARLPEGISERSVKDLWTPL